jgi:thiamine transport system ATP-binding protein
MLAARDVVVRFGERTVLDRVSLEVATGEVVALLGPSGAGKSTLLRVIAGLLVADGGSVWLDDRDITHVPSHRATSGWCSRTSNCSRTSPWRRTSGSACACGGSIGQPIATRVDELLALVGLPDFGDRSVTNLSGGEAKRVALARSLAPRPAVLLLDEPLTGLDRDLHDRLAGELADVLRATGTTALLVTHDHDEAAAIADPHHHALTESAARAATVRRGKLRA